MQQILEGCPYSSEQESKHIRDLTAEGQTWYLPICHCNHWLFLRVIGDKRVIEPYDSIQSPRRQHYGQYIIGPIQRYTKQAWRLTYWEMPQQQNGYDCGVYVLAKIQFLLSTSDQIRDGTLSRKHL